MQYYPLLLALAMPAFAGGEPCLDYMPAKAVVGGTLKRMTFPGPPGYASVARGDHPETDFYLELGGPVCLPGDADDDTAYPQTGVRRIQLSLDAKAVARLKPLLGRKLRLRGELFAAHTGHHHAPAVMVNVEPIE